MNMTSLTERLEQEYCDEVLRELRTGVIEVRFVKNDGSTRVMKCTLKTDLVVPYEKKTERVKEKNSDIVPVFDLDKQQWRSFNIKNLLEYKRVQQ